MMYYEEKEIGGILHYRTKPRGVWLPLPNNELFERLRQLRAENERLREVLQDILKEYQGIDPVK